MHLAAATGHRVIYTRYGGHQPIIPPELASPKSNYFGRRLIGGEKRGARSPASGAESPLAPQCL